MKLNPEFEVADESATELMPTPENAQVLALAGLRMLEWNELVRTGDFVTDGKAGFELWEGPSGFRADAFVKSIYRRIGAEMKRTKTKPKTRLV